MRADLSTSAQRQHRAAQPQQRQQPGAAPPPGQDQAEQRDHGQNQAEQRDPVAGPGVIHERAALQPQVVYHGEA